jgi:hypothetical protein
MSQSPTQSKNGPYIFTFRYNPIFIQVFYAIFIITGNLGLNGLMVVTDSNHVFCQS